MDKRPPYTPQYGLIVVAALICVVGQYTDNGGFLAAGTIMLFATIVALVAQSKSDP